jgi:hypothetical protein
MDIFWIIIAVSFIPELLGVKYLPRKARAASRRR